jgi:hypothetical protein
MVLDPENMANEQVFVRELLLMYPNDTTSVFRVVREIKQLDKRARVAAILMDEGFPYPKFYMGCRLGIVSWVVALLAYGHQPHSLCFYEIVINDDHDLLQYFIEYGVRKGWEFAIRVALAYNRYDLVRRLIDSNTVHVQTVMHICIREDDDASFAFFYGIYGPSAQALLVSAVKWNRPAIVSFLVQRGVPVSNRAILKAGHNNLVNILESFKKLHVISPRAYKRLHQRRHVKQGR